MIDTAASRRPGWITLAALILVPLLAVAALLGLARSSTSSVNAAIVNLDEAVTVNGQTVPMGRQLAAAMMDRDGENISWTLADAPGAAAGLKTGQYAAVVTIPKGFSAAATSFSSNDAAKAEQATIQVTVGENSPVTDAQLAQQVSSLAVNTINATLTGAYLDGIYVGFTTLGEQFTTIVDGANQLRDGSSQLADGAQAATKGATQLSDGLGQLKDGGGQLVDGVGTLADGTAALADGANQLADGVDQFATQAPALVSGVGTLADGADQLLGAVPAFADGAAQAIGGVTSIRAGLDQFIAKVGEPRSGGLDGLKALTDGANGLSGGLKQVDSAMKGYASGAVAAPAEVKAIGGQVAAGAVAAFQCPQGYTPEQCQLMSAGFAAGANAVADASVQAGFQAGTGAASTALNSKSNGTSLLDGASQLAAGVGTLESSIADESAKQKAELVAGLTQIRDGAAALETQAAPLVSAAPELSAGSTKLLGGINQLNEQIAALPAGVNQLATGARQLADGTTKLDAGMPALQTGVETYVKGVGSAADGSAELTDGLVALSAGVTKLDGGIATFASELAKGADQVPSYSQGDREKLAKVVSSPIEQSRSLYPTGQVALVSLLLLAGLWLGAVASFVVVRPVPRDVVSSRATSLALWARTLWLPAAIVAGQGVVLGIAGGVVLKLGVGSTVGLSLLLIGLGVSYVLANHALAGWLGNVGRGVAVLLFVVTLGLGLSSSLGWLAPLGVVSPLHNGFELVRTWLSGGSGEVGIAAVAILMLAVAAVASYLAIALRRQLKADRFRTRVATAA